MTKDICSCRRGLVSISKGVAPIAKARELAAGLDFRNEGRRGMDSKGDVGPEMYVVA